MPRLLTLLLPLLVVVAGPATAAAQTRAQPSDLEPVAAALARDPVYVDPDAERTLTQQEADDLRTRIRAAGSPLFVAVLAASAAPTAAEAAALPGRLAVATGLSGTYAVVAGGRFRAASKRPGASDLATAAFQARQGEGTAAVLADFVDRVARQGGAAAGGSATSSRPAPASGGDG